jgi:hypothetical protein
LWWTGLFAVTSWVGGLAIGAGVTGLAILTMLLYVVLIRYANHPHVLPS